MAKSQRCETQESEDLKQHFSEFHKNFQPQGEDQSMRKVVK